MPPSAAVRRKGESIVREHMDSENRHEFDATLGTFPPTGREFELPILALFVFDGDDKLVCERVYFDQLTVLRQLGVARDPTSLGGRLQTLAEHPLTIARGPSAARHWPLRARIGGTMVPTDRGG